MYAVPVEAVADASTSLDDVSTGSIHDTVSKGGKKTDVGSSSFVDTNIACDAAAINS